MDLGNTVLIIFLFCVLLFVGIIIGKLVERRKWATKIKQIREDAVKRSRAVLTGKFSEQLAPYMPDFKYSPTEVRFVGRPIDFIVFKGMDMKQPSEVVFIEVKSRNSTLSTPERKLRDVIKAGNVSWELYRIPKLSEKKQ